MSLFDNLTQAAGVIAFMGVFVICAFAMRIVFWRWLAVTYFLYASEIVIGLRHMLRSPVVDVMQAVGVYQERGTLQLVLLASLLLVVALSIGSIGGYWAVRKRQKAKFKVRYCLALVATGLLFQVFLIELVSLHNIDALFYRSLGGLMAIAWLWIGLSTIVALAALPDVRLSMLFHIGKAADKKPG